MNRIIAIIIVACMLVALVGCDGDIADNGSESVTTGGVTTENDGANGSEGTENDGANGSEGTENDSENGSEGTQNDGENGSEVTENDGENGSEGTENDGENGSEGTENDGENGSEVTENDGENGPGESESEGSGSADTETVEGGSDRVEISEDHAPDFEIIDWNGNKVKLSDLFGKPIVLNFWASGCGPCRNEMPDFQVAYEKYGDEVQFMMVNYIGFFGETVDSAKAFINDQGYTFPVYFDTENRAAATYGINSIPQTFFIGANGELVAYGQGMLDMAALEQGISMIID